MQLSFIRHQPAQDKGKLPHYHTGIVHRHHAECQPPWLEIAHEYDLIHPRTEPVKEGCWCLRWCSGGSSLAFWSVELVNGMMNLLASCLITARVCVFSFDGFLSLSIAVLSTLFWFYYAPEYTTRMSTNVIAIAVIFPITSGINMAFTRRERALGSLGQLLGNTRSTWDAMHSWLVPGTNSSGEKAFVRVMTKYTADEQEKIQQLFHEFLTSLVIYFNVMRFNRARQNEFGCGMQEEREEIRSITYQQRLSVDSRISRLRQLVQSTKHKGLAGGEVHRVDNYLQMLGSSFQTLTHIKEYRTPLAFTSFARLFILLMPLLYGPHYVNFSRGLNKDKNNLALSIAFACAIQLILVGLLHVLISLEDPFVYDKTRVDGIKVVELVEVTRRQLVMIRQEAAKAELSGVAPWMQESAKVIWDPLLPAAAVDFADIEANVELAQ